MSVLPSDFVAALSATAAAYRARFWLVEILVMSTQVSKDLEMMAELAEVPVSASLRLSSLVSLLASVSSTLYRWVSCQEAAGRRLSLEMVMKHRWLHLELGTMIRRTC
jgi:hypothetical protein